MKQIITCLSDKVSLMKCVAFANLILLSTVPQLNASEGMSPYKLIAALAFVSYENVTPSPPFPAYQGPLPSPTLASYQSNSVSIEPAVNQLSYRPKSAPFQSSDSAFKSFVPYDPSVDPKFVVPQCHINREFAVPRCSYLNQRTRPQQGGPSLESFRSELSTEQKAEKIAEVMQELLIMQEENSRKSVALITSKGRELYDKRTIAAETDQINQSIDRVPEDYWSLVPIGEWTALVDPDYLLTSGHKQSRFVGNLMRKIIKRISEDDISQTFSEIKGFINLMRLRRSYTYP